MPTSTNWKDKVLNSVEELLSTAEQFKNVNIENLKDERLLSSFNEYKEIISKGIEELNKHILEIKNSAEWKKFSIGFFGETNAGKSTIIEALTNGDGKSIGDGRKDYTKDIKKIPYKENINLIDMPGIEGREEIIIKNIFKGIHKSHLIFYVIGNNKEPERHTINKVRKFLSNEGKVYSIINVKSFPSEYKYTNTIVLKDKNIQIIESRTKDKMKDILGEQYAGNIICHGLLAFLTNSNISREEFKKQKEKAIEIFGSIPQIEDFSNIKQLKEVIEKESKEIHKHIAVSNVYKFLKTINFILSDLLKAKKGFDNLLKMHQEQTEELYNSINRKIKDYYDQIITKTKIRVDEFNVNLKKKIKEHLDSNNADKLEAEIKRLIKENSDKIEAEIKKDLENMNKEIETKIQIFENRISLGGKFFDFSEISIDLNAIMEKLNISFKYVLKQIGEIASSLIPLIIKVINPILGLILVGMTLIKKLFDWFFNDPKKRRDEAMAKANSEIDKATKKIKKEIMKGINKNFESLRKEIKNNHLSIESNNKAFKTLSRKINEVISRFNITQVELSNLLGEQVLEVEIPFSYIDIGLSMALFVGVKKDNDLKGLFRLKKIWFYKDLQSWFNNIEMILDKDTIIVNKVNDEDEFSYRAIHKLIDFKEKLDTFNKKAINFRIVRKKEVDNNGKF